MGSMRAEEDGYMACSIYVEHGACSCSTGVPGNVCPLDLHPSRYEGERWACEEPENPSLSFSADGRCPACCLAAEAKARFYGVGSAVDG